MRHDLFWLFFWLDVQIARAFLSQSLSAVEQNKIKCELLSPLTWKRPVLCLHTKKRKSSQVACKLLHHAWGYLVFKELHSPFAVIKLHIIWLIYSFYKFNTSVFFPFGDRILKQPANFATFSWKAKRKNKTLKNPKIIVFLKKGVSKGFILIWL